ncbi:MAG: CNNM domain-containing protein [Lacipirellulaceae bacterium]
MIPLLVFALGVFFSGFFSGCETGFYSLPRVRLVIDAVSGDRIARGLLWASNNPAAVVATALVGNCLSDYATTFATVVAVNRWFPGGGLVAELLPTLLLAPFVFIFGELLPKRTFLQAPYSLMRAVAPMFASVAVLLSPLTSVLWGGSRFVAWLTGSSVAPLRMSLRRRELADVFAEGQAAGILTAVQRQLAMATFALAGKPVREFMTPVAREQRLTQPITTDKVLLAARRSQLDALPIESRSGGRASYRLVRASRCVLAAPGDAPQEEPMPEFSETTTFLQVITQLESSGQPLAALRGAGDRVVGFVRLERLQRALWEGE